MGHKFSSNDEVNILNDDALVSVFAFLSIEERLKVSSVCHRWRTVVTDGRLWKTIDIWKETAVKTTKRRRNSMLEGSAQFYKSWAKYDTSISVETSMLYFMQRYAGPSLKVIRLKIVSTDILLHLRNKCLNLKEMSFMSRGTDTVVPVTFALDLTTPQRFVERFYFPENVETLRLTLKGLRIKSADKVELSLQLMKRLASECTKLSHLSLDNFFLPEEGVSCLAKNDHIKLKELWLTGVPEDPRKLDSILYSVVDDFKSLTSFKLSTSKSYIGNVNRFIKHMATNWTDLRHLGLKGGTLCPVDVFQDMATKLCQIRILELEGSIITNAVIDIIASDLTLLSDLELTNGYYTAQGIKYLVGHSCLKRLGLFQKHLTPSPLWLHAVFEVIASLPGIENVKLIGNRLRELYVSEYYVLKAVKSEIHIKIEDSIPDVRRQSQTYNRTYSRYPGRQVTMPVMALDVNW